MLDKIQSKTVKIIDQSIRAIKKPPCARNKEGTKTRKEWTGHDGSQGNQAGTLNVNLNPWGWGLNAKEKERRWCFYSGELARTRRRLSLRWRLEKLHTPVFPGSLDGKASAYNAGDTGSIPGSGRSPGEGNGNLLQYSCLENPMDGGAWQSTVHGVIKSQTWLSD